MRGAGHRTLNRPAGSRHPERSILGLFDDRWCAAI